MTLRTSRLQSRYEAIDRIVGNLFKVTSTENAIIFGNIVYDITGSQSDRNCVVLNDIKIDIMDYIQPAFCSDQVEFYTKQNFVYNFRNSERCGPLLSGRIKLLFIQISAIFENFFFILSG